MSGVPLPSSRALGSLADEFGGQVEKTSRARRLSHIAAVEHATTDALVPVLTHKALNQLFKQLGDTQAAVLLPPELAQALAQQQAKQLTKEGVPQRDLWIHPHARWALASLLTSLTPPPTPFLSAHAIVEQGTTIASNVRVGPGAVILSGAKIDTGSIIESNAVIYGCVRLGCRVTVGAGAIVGRAGFGWCHGPEGELLRMPQLGGVVVEDDVEIGPLATVDAGTLKPTRLRRGCKLDAQVHVGHNVEIGEATMIAAQSGFAGSVTVGHHVLAGGQVGVADHATIGDHARLAGRSGVIGNIPPHATVAGYPAVDRLRWLRAVARMMRGRT